MSTTTFRKIRQLENGDFLVTTSCSNDTCEPHEWTMDWFTISYPDKDNQYKRAALLLYGLYTGDRYYPEAWQRKQKYAIEFAREWKERYGDNNSPYHDPQAYSEFATVLQEKEKERIPKVFAVFHLTKYSDTKDPNAQKNFYVRRLTKKCRKIGVTDNIETAQVFHKSVDDLQTYLAEIPPNLEPVILYINKKEMVVA